MADLSGAGWQRNESSRQVSTPTQWLMAADGTQCGVDMHTTRRRRWLLQGRRNQTEADAIITLFESTQSSTGSGNSSITFEDLQEGSHNSPGGLFNVEFLSRPQLQWLGPDLLLVTVELVEVE